MVVANGIDVSHQEGRWPALRAFLTPQTGDNPPFGSSSGQHGAPRQNEANITSSGTAVRACERDAAIGGWRGQLTVHHIEISRVWTQAEALPGNDANPP